MSSLEQQERVRRVAVIGVHGVAHHDAGATANAMADLLLSVPSKNRTRPSSYETFSATGIRVPVQMLQVEPLPPGNRGKIGKLFRPFEERSATFARIASERGAEKKREGKSIPPGSVGNAYMKLLLECYRGGADGNFYSTTRLEGKRSRSDSHGAAEVHIYEMLWADLARPTNTVLSFLFSLFQLVLHLGSLSRLAIDTGSAENPRWIWKTYCSFHRNAVRILQMPIALLKVVLLITLLACVPSLLIPSKNQPVFAILIAGLVGLALTYLANEKSTRAVKNSPWTWPLRAALPAAIAMAVAWGLLRKELKPDVLLALESWILVGSTLVLYVLGKYESVRKGVKRFGLGLYCFFALLFAYYAYAAYASSCTAVQSSLWTAIWVLAALRVSWILLFVLALLALGLGSLAWRSIKDDENKRARARAAVRTSRFALALPTLLFLLITTVLWAGMFSIGRAIRYPFFNASVLKLGPYQNWLPRFNLAPDPADTRSTTNATCDSGSNPGCAKKNLAMIEPLPPEAYREPHDETPSHGSLAQITPVPDEKEHFKPDYLRDVLNWSVTDAFAIALLILAAVLFLLFWWVLPGVMTEKFPLRGDSQPPRASTNAQTTRLGTWTSRGLDATSVLTFLLWMAIFAIPPLFLIATPLARFLPTWVGTGIKWNKDLSQGLVHSLAALGAASVMAVVIRYGSPVLSAILDVDTYLRTSPTNATPRAKIAERYISLLRYLQQYRGADSRGYDSIVIVSHSLGTLISADLLRFLHHDGTLEQLGFGENPDDPEKRLVPIKLLTMGSPIRQLLNRFFPFLYDWVRPSPDNGLYPLPKPATDPPVPTIEARALPDPADLGVTEWRNLYRSGDYVGRSLWLDEWYRRTASGNPNEMYLARAPRRSEGCIGAGAHTHYWDDTAVDVARELDSLI